MTRNILLLLASAAACAHAPAPRKSDPAPEAVEAEMRHAAAVFTDAQCESLGTATAGLNGFYVNAKTVAAPGHLVEGRNPLYVQFAVVGPDGTCRNAQYANWYYEDPGIDLLFLRVYGRHEAGGVRLAGEVPPAGLAVYSFSRADAARRPEDDWVGRPLAFLVFSTTTVPLPSNAPKLPRDPFVSARRTLVDGDSGSPLLTGTGDCVGMYLAEAANEKTGESVGVYLSAWVIKALLAGCGPCEEEDLTF
jgi:hypothetical protein